MFDVRVGFFAGPRELALVDALAVTVAGFIVALANLSTVVPGQGPLRELLAVVSLLLACFAAGMLWESRGIEHRCRVREVWNMAGLQTHTVQRPRNSVLGLECCGRISRRSSG